MSGTETTMADRGQLPDTDPELMAERYHALISERNRLKGRLRECNEALSYHHFLATLRQDHEYRAGAR